MFCSRLFLLFPILFFMSPLFIMIASPIFPTPRDETGLGATFFARNYDGDRLQIPLTKVNILHTTRKPCTPFRLSALIRFLFFQDTLESPGNLMIYELMRMQGNQTKAAHDSLEAIKGTFLVL